MTDSKTVTSTGYDAGSGRIHRCGERSHQCVLLGFSSASRLDTGGAWRRGEAIPADRRTRTRAWEEAVRSLGIEPEPRVRPNPARWLWYAFWGPLPVRYRLWVLYDVTCYTWVFRHLARILTIAVLPVAAVVLFLPAPVHLRLLTAFVAGAGAFLFTAVWVNEATEYRLLQAGWRWGIGPEVRERRNEIAEWIVSVRRL